MLIAAPHLPLPTPKWLSLIPSCDFWFQFPVKADPGGPAVITQQLSPWNKSGGLLTRGPAQPSPAQAMRLPPVLGFREWTNGWRHFLCLSLYLSRYSKTDALKHYQCINTLKSQFHLHSQAQHVGRNINFEYSLQHCAPAVSREGYLFSTGIFNKRNMCRPRLPIQERTQRIFPIVLPLPEQEAAPKASMTHQDSIFCLLLWHKEAQGGSSVVSSQ